MHRFGKRLRVSMITAGVSLDSLAKQLGVSPQIVRKWIRDTEPHLSAKHLLDAAKLLHVRGHWLGTGEGPATRFHASEYSEEEMLKMFRALGERERVLLRDLAGIIFKYLED